MLRSIVLLACAILVSASKCTISDSDDHCFTEGLPSEADESSLLQAQQALQQRKSLAEQQATKVEASSQTPAYYTCVRNSAGIAAGRSDWDYHGWTSKCKSDDCLVSNGRGCVTPPKTLLDTPMSEIIDNYKKGSLSKGSPSPLYEGKVLRIRAPVMDGFFVRAMFVMVSGEFAATNRIPFFVDLDEVDYDAHDGIGPAPNGSSKEMRFDAYFDPNATGDRWEQYFKPIDNISRKDVYKTVPESRILELDARWAWIMYFFVEQPYPKNFPQAIIYRNRRATQYKHWVQPTDEITDAVKEQWTRNMPTSPSQGNSSVMVLGVHMRGTDKFLGGGKVDPSSYWPFIDNFISHHEKQGKTVYVFFASDDMSYIKKAMHRYPTRAFKQSNVPRATGNNAIWKNHDTSKAHKRGLSVFVDSMMLSKCDFIIKSASAVSEFALYMNPKLIMNSHDLSIPDQPMAPWAKGLKNPFLDDSLR